MDTEWDNIFSALEHLIVETVGDKFNTLDRETLTDTDLRNAS